MKCPLLPGRRLCRVLAFVVIAFGSHAIITGQPDPTRTSQYEYRLKAAFVYQFAQFVDWPPSVWQGAKTIQFCVTQPNPFGAELEQLLHGESLKGRPLTVKEVPEPERVIDCQVLFAHGSRADVVAFLKGAAGRPILTVGDGPDFLDAGGMIGMKVVDGRLRFEINATTAQKVGVRVSSQLLSVALTVRGGP